MCGCGRACEAAESQGGLQNSRLQSWGTDQTAVNGLERRLAVRCGMVALSRGYHRTDKLLSLILGDVSMRSDDSAFSVEHGSGVRRDTSGFQQHYREASIAAAAAAAAAAVQQHQQKQQQLLTQEHRLAELMQSGDPAPSGRIPPGAPTSITADARAVPPAASSRSAGRPPHQRQHQSPQQPQPQQQLPPQPMGADAPASPDEEPLRNHPHYRMLKEINRCVLALYRCIAPGALAGLMR